MRKTFAPKSKTSRFFLFFAAWAFLSLFNVQRVQAVSCGSVPAGGSYTLSASCNFSGTVDGVDNGGITVATGKTLTVNPGQTIVWSPGQSIIIEGSIAISSTGQLQQTYLWLTDADNDGYPVSATMTAATGSPGAGYRQRSALTSYSSLDYNDNPAAGGASVYPGTNCGTACTVNNTDGTCGNAGVDTDPGSLCTGLDCDGGATKYYNGWTSGTCYYMLDVSAANHVCDGSGACKTAAVQCAASTQGATTGVTRTTCKSQVGCTGTTAGSLGDVANGSDTYTECSDAQCYTGNCDGSAACGYQTSSQDLYSYCAATGCNTGLCVGGSDACGGAVAENTSATVAGNVVFCGDSKLWSITHSAGHTWNPAGSGSCTDACDYCNNLSYAGSTDWILPDRDTLAALYGNVVCGSCAWDTYCCGSSAAYPYDYWSSTEFNSSTAYYVNFNNDTVGGYYKTTSFSVRCVRQ